MISLLKNSVFNFFSQITIFISGALLSIFFARLLGPEKMGEFSFWVWLVTTGGLFLTLGIPQSLVKFIPQYQSNKKTLMTQIISRVFITYIKLLCLTAIVVYPAIFLFGGIHKTTHLIGTTTILIYSLNSLLSGVLAGLQKYTTILKINFIVSCSSLLIFLIVLTFNNHLNSLLLANLIIALILLGCLIYNVKDLIKVRAIKLPTKIYSEIKNYALPVSLIVFLDLILMDKSEVFFLKNFSSLEQVAYYSISFSLVSKLMVLIPGAVSGIIMPKVSFLHGTGNKEGIRATYKVSSRYLMFITFPIIFAGIMLVDLPVKFLYGEDYMPSVPIIKILLISGGLSAVAAGGSSILYGIGKQSFILKLAIFAASINIFLDFLLIPKYGAIGGAVANFSAQVAGVFIGVYYLVQIRKMNFPWLDGFKIFSSGLISLILVYFIRNESDLFGGSKIILEFTISGGIFVLLYFIILFTFKFFNNQDSEIFNRILKKLPLNYEK